jgi:hypothetical protein
MPGLQKRKRKRGKGKDRSPTGEQAAAAKPAGFKKNGKCDAKKRAPGGDPPHPPSTSTTHVLAALQITNSNDT